MNYMKMVGKFLVTAGIAIAVFLLSALLKGLGLEQPDNPILAQVWPLCQAAVMGGIAAAINWLKHKDDSKKN